MCFVLGSNSYLPVMIVSKCVFKTIIVFIIEKTTHEYLVCFNRSSDGGAIVVWQRLCGAVQTKQPVGSGGLSC